MQTTELLCPMVNIELAGQNFGRSGLAKWQVSSVFSDQIAQGEAAFESDWGENGRVSCPNLDIVARSAVWSLGDELDNEARHVIGLHGARRQWPITQHTQEHRGNGGTHTK